MKFTPTFQLQPAFVTMQKQVTDALIERDHQVWLAILALLTRQHLVLIGGVGCAKSALCKRICEAMGGDIDLFSRLLTAFTAPEELFGSIDVPAMKESRHRRVTTGRMPECTVANLDELFLGSSSLLNTTLALLNEREFTQETDTIKCPLWTCYGSSNSFPVKEENGALKDRFLFRDMVKPIASSRGLNRLLWDDDLEAPSPSTVNLQRSDLEAAHSEVLQVEVSPEARGGFVKIVGECRRQGIQPGDRRLRQSVTACRAAAWLAASPTVEPIHLEVLANTLWIEPAEQPAKVAEIVGKVANPTGLKVNSLLIEGESVLRDLNSENVADIAEVAAKLGEIHEKLKEIAGDKAVQAAAHIKGELLEINRKVFEGIN